MKQAVLEASYISEFCMELHLIVRAGIPFQEGIALLLEEEADSFKQSFLQQLHQKLQAGEPLAVALKQTGVFPHYAVEMVAIGQSTGHLENVFYALSNYYERMEQIKHSIHNIIWYPMILLAMMLFVVLVLLIKVMPIFADVFAQLGATFSPVAQILLQTGKVLGQYGLYILAIVAAAGLILFVLWHKTSLRMILQQWAKGITADWNVSRLLVSSKLADALVLTISSGMTVDDALDMAGQLVQEQSVQERIAQCKKAMLLEGKSFAEACMEYQLFAPMYCRMIAVGFRTGDMDTVLEEVARRIANDADDALDALLNRIEPALVVVLSLMVGVILLSVMLPLMGIMSAIG